MYDLSKITEFNPAIIYGVVPEELNTQTVNTLNYTFHALGQYEDIYEAYLYAQNEILPKIKENEFSPKFILNSILEIQIRMACTMAKISNYKTGEYSKEPLIQWVDTTTYAICFEEYLLNRIPIEKVMATLIFQKHPNPLQKCNELHALKQLITQYSNRDDIEIEKELEIDLSKHPNDQQKMAMGKNRLISAYYQNKLSSEEIAIIEKIFIICTLQPSEYSKAMDNFARNLSQKWRKCDANNLSEITDLAAFAYYNFVEILPFIELNERIGMLLVNIILRSLNQPSILMAYPREHLNPDSAYSKIISNINLNKSLLKKEIENRILDTVKNGAFSDGDLENKTKKQIDIFYILQKILKEFPAFNLNKKIEEIEQTTQKTYGTLGTSPIEVAKASNLGIQLLNETYEQLKNPQKPKFFISKATVEEAKTVVQLLEQITGEKGFKPFNANTGFVVLLYLDERNKADAILKSCLETKAMSGKIQQDPQKKTPVVYLDNIQLEKLKEALNHQQRFVP